MISSIIIFIDMTDSNKTLVTWNFILQNNSLMSDN
jgi:hypothetical protein